MDKTKSSLEKFLENYLKNKRITNSADSFDEYRAKNAHDYDGEYARGVESAYVKAMKANADYGAKAERIFSSGLSGSGYAERQRQLSGEGYQKQLEELLGLLAAIWIPIPVPQKSNALSNSPSEILLPTRSPTLWNIFSVSFGSLSAVTPRSVIFQPFSLR